VRPTGIRRIWELWRGGQSDVASLQARIQFLGGTRDLAFVFVAVVFPGVTGVHWLRDGGVGLTFIGFMGYLELVSVLVLVLSRLRLRDLQAELRTLDFEEEIKQNAAESPILLFLKHQAELKRYYDQALQQSGLAFVLGVICVASGLGVIAAGFVLVQEVNSTERIVTAALAGVGAILSGFVARVYLGIHRGAVESLTGFHGKFVETHHLHVAGVFASKVDGDDAWLALVQAAANPRQVSGDFRD
jgi:hypothetical protein